MHVRTNIKWERKLLRGWNFAKTLSPPRVPQRVCVWGGGVFTVGVACLGLLTFTHISPWHWAGILVACGNWPKHTEKSCKQKKKTVDKKRSWCLKKVTQISPVYSDCYYRKDIPTPGCVAIFRLLLKKTEIRCADWEYPTEKAFKVVYALSATPSAPPYIVNSL